MPTIRRQMKIAFLEISKADAALPTRMPKRHGRPTRGGDTDKTYLTDDPSRKKDGLLPYVATKPERKKRYRDKGHDRIMSSHPLDERDVSPVSSGKRSADGFMEYTMHFERVIRVGVHKFQVQKVIFNAFWVETEPTPAFQIYGSGGPTARFDDFRYI